MTRESCFEGLEIINQLEQFNNFLRGIDISFDMDGVEVDSGTPAVGKINTELGANFLTTDIKSYWGLIDLVEGFLEVNPDKRKKVGDVKRFIIGIWNNPAVMSASRPEQGALILSSYFFRNEIFVHRITSRPSHLTKTTFDWYAKYMPWVKKEFIHIQENEKEIHSGFKVGEIDRLKIKIHFDDSSEHAEDITRRTKAFVILVPQSSNQDYVPPTGSKILRVPDAFYPDVPKMVRVYFFAAEQFKKGLFV